MKNRHGYNVELHTIDKVEVYDDGGAAITYNTGTTFGVSNDELDGFVPEVGDALVMFTKNFSMVMGIIIENHVLRYKTPAQAAKDHEAMLNKFRLDKLEAYVKHGDELKARAKKLPKALAERMERFSNEGGTEFWIESAGYEMACLEGAAALIRKVHELGFIHSDHTNFGVAEGANDDIEGAIKWINDWWNMNEKEGGYDYKGQMALVPDFGEGHSGFTASAAKSIAIAILEGQEV